MQKLIIAVAALLLTNGLSAQNRLLNGDLESPGLSSTETIRHLDQGSNLLQGWTVIDDGVGERPFYARRPITDAAFSGEYGLILNQGSGIRTTFRVEAGTFYELSFYLRPNDCPQCFTPAPLRVTISDTAYSIPVVSGWNRQVIQFFATNSVNTLEFRNVSSSGDYKQFGIDEISVVKVTGVTLNFRMYPGVIVEGSIGQRYLIQGATDLNAPNWVTLTNVLVTNTPFFFLDYDPKRLLDYPPKDRRIYRAIQVP